MHKRNYRTQNKYNKYTMCSTLHDTDDTLFDREILNRTVDMDTN